METLKSTIIELLKETTGNRLIYLTHYGSKREQSDIDLLAVYEYPLASVAYSIGRLDICAFDSKHFLALLDVHDIMVTEPLLTGILLWGNEEEWQSIKRKFYSTPPTIKSFYHMQARAVHCIEYSQMFLEKYKATKNHPDAFSFWQNLSFAAGYVGFRKTYADTQHPVTLDSARAYSREMEAVLRMKDRAKSIDSLPSPEDMHRYLDKIKESVIENRPS